MQAELICIEGNIGIGKTTLVKRLSAHLGVPAFFEEFEENPLLPLFYADPVKHALDLELSFLRAREKQLLRIRKEQGEKTLLSDYTLDKCLLFAEANLSEAQYKDYAALHKEISGQVPQAGRVIVIHSEVKHLLSNIRERNRNYERSIASDYLERLNRSYRDFFTKEHDYAVLNIFTRELDEPAYEKIFREISAFLKTQPFSKNLSLEI